MLSLALALGFFCLNSTAATTVVVTAQNFSFSPNAVTIAVGDSVSFNNAGGDHNVTGYNPAPPPERFCGTALLGVGPMCTVTFTNAGVFQFRCVPHSSGSGASFSGMIGSITVTSPPAIASVVPGQSYLLPGASLTLSLTNPPSVPSTYQWQFNSTNLPGATGPTLALSNVTTNHTGAYRVTVSNAFAIVTTAAAAVQVVDRVTFTAQPKSISVLPGTNITFSVAALSPLSITYQWQLNGTNLPGATNATLTITNAQFDPHAGYYRALASDTASSALSDTANLARPRAPGHRQPATGANRSSRRHRRPQRQRHAGSSAPALELPLAAQRDDLRGPRPIHSHRDQSLGGYNLPRAGDESRRSRHQPHRHRHRSGRQRPRRHGRRVGNSSRLRYQQRGRRRARFRRRWPAATATNTRPATDPRDPTSRLKIESLTRTETNAVVLQFQTLSNRTYTVQFSSEATGDVWTNLAHFDARTTNATEWLTNSIPNTAARGFYRIVTPRQP
jgi:plastocyanin